MSNPCGFSSRLYVTARLVHADLNENNILVCPAYVVENKDETVFMSDDENQVQAVFIDFAHAVDINHPQATALLERDVEQVRKFFVKKGITTLGRKMAMEFITSPYPDAVDGEVKVDEPVVHEEMPSSANDSRGRCIATATATAKEPVSMITVNNSCTKSNQTIASGVVGETCEGALKQSFRTISSTSFSTKSSLSSFSSSKDKVSLGLKSSSRGMSLNSASTNSTGLTPESSRNEMGKKDKKEKKLKKEKKEKKKKKELSKDSSSSKRKSKELKPEQNKSVVDHDLFPIRTGSPENLFDDSEFDDVFESEKIEWDVEWNEDVFGGMKSI